MSMVGDRGPRPSRAGARPTGVPFTLPSSVPPPPPPRRTHVPLPQPPFVAPERPKGWRKFFAIMGIIGGFFVLLTIPGWVALDAYRKWSRGEREQPNVLIGWGMIVSVLAFGLVLGVVGPVAEHTPKSVSTTVRPTFGPPGLTASAAPDGWTTYTSDVNGFSISLPPGWEPYPDDDPKAMLSALESDPGHAKFPDGMTPALTLIRLGGALHYPPGRYEDLIRRGISRLKHVDSKVLMESVYLPAGKAHVFRYTMTSKAGVWWVTWYVWLDSTWEYRLIIAVPLDRQNEYAALSDSIARSFAP